MNRICFIIILTGFSFLLNGQLVITEIMYNPPEAGEDSTEYVEILNIGNSPISLEDYSFTSGIEMVFGDTLIESGTYLVVTNNSQAFAAYYGFEALEWEAGNLSNSGETIALSNVFGTIVDEVSFDDEGNWPSKPDGNGYSLELCDPYKDNNNYQNWKPSLTPTGLMIDGKQIFATPGAENGVTCGGLVDHTVDVLTSSFDPKNLVINAGESVQWINNSGGNHNVNGTLDVYPNNPESFYSGAPSNESWVFTHTFTVPGNYKYRCDLHVLIGMTGTIEVLPEEAAKLIITEIMYNDPGAGDSLEFVEFLNIGEAPINLADFTFESDEINFTFPDISIDHDQIILLCKYPDVISAYFGKTGLAWGNGSLKNNGDELFIKNTSGNTVDHLKFEDNIPWPTLGDGFGHSIGLCHPESDNEVPENWQATPVPAGFDWEGTEIFANPGDPSYCSYSIGEVTQINPDGTLLYENKGVELTGTVHGVNLRPDALEFTIIGSDNQGISLFNPDQNFGYEVQEGEKITVIGKTNQYYGLAQVILDSIFYYGHQGDLSQAVVVDELNEDTESQLVTLQNVHLVNPAEWGGNSTGFNIEVTDGNHIFVVRIDDDVNLFNENYPTGSFNITGIGSQYDSSPPYLDGYQLMPRYIQDIDPFIPNQYMDYPIGLITTIDENGVVDSLGTKCRIEGIVYGINFNPSGYSFILIDDNTDGITIYLNNGKLGYEVKEGDRLGIKGTVSQYNGLAELEPDEIEWISSDNLLLEPTGVTELNESTESQLIRLAYLTLVEPGQWEGAGNSFNVEATNGTNTFLIRIDKDCELANTVAPAGSFHITGLGSQYDETSPYTEGYQILPRYATDIDLVGNSSTESELPGLCILPNPSDGRIRISTVEEIISIKVYDLTGHLVGTPNPKFDTAFLDLNYLESGLYTILVLGKRHSAIQKIQIIK